MKTRLRNKPPAHFCQDGHDPVWYNDSEHERCPVCREKDAHTITKTALRNVTSYTDTRRMPK